MRVEVCYSWLRCYALEGSENKTKSLTGDNSRVPEIQLHLTGAQLRRRGSLSFQITEASTIGKARRFTFRAATAQERSEWLAGFCCVPGMLR